MRKFTIFSCIILFVIASCNNEDEISDSASLNNQDDSTSEIILQERDPNLPKVWSKKIAPRPKTRTAPPPPTGVPAGPASPTTRWLPIITTTGKRMWT